jgi:hypothetical protein
VSDDATLITYRVIINDGRRPYQVDLTLDSDMFKNADEKGPRYLTDRRYIIRKFRDQVYSEYEREMLTVKWENLEFVVKQVRPHIRKSRAAE